MSQSEKVTVKDMMALADVSKVTLLKILSVADLQPIGKVTSGGRGRPALLFDRAAFLAVLAGRAVSKKDAVDEKPAAIAACETFVAEPAVDNTETVPETVVQYTMSVDEINAMMAD
jgi:hypothetical protein